MIAAIKNNPANSWQDNTRDIFRYRIKEMLKGDALVSLNNVWRIYCLPDQNNNPMYVIFINGEEAVKRKRLESVVDYMIANKAPIDFRFVRDGAFHMMRQYGNDDVFIGSRSPYMPNDVERIVEADVSSFNYVRSKETNGVAKMVTMIYDEVIRILVGSSRNELFNRA